MKTQPSNRTAQALPICRLGRVARPRRSANGATVTSIFKLRQHRSSLRAFPRRSHFPSCKNIEIAPNQSRRWRSSGGKPPFPTCELPYALFCFRAVLLPRLLTYPVWRVMRPTAYPRHVRAVGLRGDCPIAPLRLEIQRYDPSRFGCLQDQLPIHQA